MTDVLSIALSGLNAQNQRLAATASNIANASTAGPVPGTAPSAPVSTAVSVYKPLNVNLTSMAGGGVQAQVSADENGYSIVYDPSSPYANSDGMIAAPNVDFIKEMVSLLETKAAFKANLAVLKTQDEMSGELLDTLV